MNPSILTTRLLENPSPVRTSDLLRGILTNNPGVERFTIKRILRTIGKDRFDLSLMMFSLPAIIPVPAPSGVVAMPAGAIGAQLLGGRTEITLPRFVLKKSVSRKSLAVAIHAVLPLIEAAERVMRPRWAWVSHEATQRVLGLFVLLLALAIGFPLLGLTPLHATSIFVIALGMAEKDGLAVLIGVVTGILALVITLSSGASARALRSSGLRWLRKLMKRTSFTLAANKLEQSGHPMIANLLRFKWTDLFLAWDPEGPLQPPTRAKHRQSNLVRLRPSKPRALRLAELRESIEGTRVLRVDQRRARVGQKARLQAVRAPEQAARDAEQVD